MTDTPVPNPFSFDLVQLLDGETYAEFEKLGDFKKRMADINNAIQKGVADLLVEGVKLKVSDRVLWLMACSNISALLSSTLLNLTDHHHDDIKPSPTLLHVGAAMSAVCSTMVRRNFTAMLKALKTDGMSPSDMGLRRTEEGEEVSMESLRKVLTKGGLPLGEGVSQGEEFVYLNQLGVSLFGEMIERSPIQVELSKSPQGTNIDFERQAHGLKIELDEEKMARSMAQMYQEIARSVTGFFMANGKSTEALNISHHALSMLIAYCASVNVNVVRRNEEKGREMTRMDAANLFIVRICETASETIGEMLTEFDKRDAEEKLRFQQPVGEA